MAYVAPIGMQNLFVINSAMTQKLRRVIATVLIIIFWDISLGIACFLGAGALMEALPWLQKIILGVKRRKRCKSAVLENYRFSFYRDMVKSTGFNRRDIDAGCFLCIFNSGKRRVFYYRICFSQHDLV